MKIVKGREFLKMKNNLIELCKKCSLQKKCVDGRLSVDDFPLNFDDECGMKAEIKKS